MKNFQPQIRKLILDQNFVIKDSENNQSGNVAPMLNMIEPGTSYPYIYIRSNTSTGSNENQSAFGSDNIITFEVHTRFQRSSGGDKNCNFITNNLIDQIITKASNPWYDQSSDPLIQYKIFSVELDNINFLQEMRSDHYYVRSIIDINFKTMEK